MADLTLNEKISSWFEPRPDYKPAFRKDGIAQELDGQPSKKGFWIWHYLGGWSPLDYLHDEAANAKLLEAMPYGNVLRLTTEPPLWECRGSEWTGDFKHADRKTAVVLAFCKWAGIPVEEEMNWWT